MTNRQWVIVAGVFFALTTAAVPLLRSARDFSRRDQAGPPVTCADDWHSGRGILLQTIADNERHDIDLTRYWSALDVASLDALRAAEAVRAEEVEELLTSLPVPERIRLTVVHVSDTGRYVLMGSSDPKRSSDGGYLAVLRNHSSSGWELCGSMRIPPGSNFWGVWLDSAGKWLVSA
jgi:hypothetical protein